MSFRYLFLYSDRRLLHRPHLRQPKGAGTIMRFFGVKIAVFFFAVGDSQKQKGLCLLQSAAALEACRALGKALAE